MTTKIFTKGRKNAKKEERWKQRWMYLPLFLSLAGSDGLLPHFGNQRIPSVEICTCKGPTHKLSRIKCWSENWEPQSF
jgi:hypothetical protein